MKLWQPSQQAIEKSQMMQFIRFIGKPFNHYSELYLWSITEPEIFWQKIAEFCQLTFKTEPTKIITKSDHFFNTQWFTGATLNFAERLLLRNDDKIALISTDELGRRTALTYQALRKNVAQLANHLREIGIKKGDRIAGILPNCAETVIAMLATTSLGAIWSACSPDFGEQAILDRFQQIEPKILFAVETEFFHGKRYNILSKIKNILDQLPSVQKTIFIPFVDSIDLSDFKQATLWQDCLHASTELNFTEVEFNDPVYILYSSGTTGIPKCIVHGAGRVLIQHLKELILHTDLTCDDILFYYTTCSWMMWHWSISALAVGATLVLYEGSPAYPHAASMFDLIDREHISVWGTSAKLISRLEKLKLKPRETHSLKSLRTILSTGSPLLNENFMYVYDAIKKDLCLSSISGGTDIISCFALGNPILPVYVGQLQCRGLGMAVNIFDEQGNPIKNQRGELVCTQPFPSTPIYFWNDPSYEKYQQAYFSKYAEIWYHGDFAELTDEEGIVIYGRSDATLNPNGIRIGTAEIYRLVENVDEVLESLAIGQQWKNDERIILFVVLREGLILDDILTLRIKKAIREGATARHVPTKVIQVPEVPKTMNGKVVELAVKHIIHGREVKNQAILINPASLNYFKNLSELKSD